MDPYKKSNSPLRPLLLTLAFFATTFLGYKLLIQDTSVAAITKVIGMFPFLVWTPYIRCCVGCRCFAGDFCGWNSHLPTVVAQRIGESIGRHSRAFFECTSWLPRTVRSLLTPALWTRILQCPPVNFQSIWRPK